jgi:Zn-dependent peptidase ImmA (M78 family)
MKHPGEYDPYEHAERLGIAVLNHPLRSANGIWIPDERVILIRPRMRALLERSVLAHEVAHATLGHRDDSPRSERQADTLAARRLIDPDRLIEVARGSADHGEWCVELDVTPHVLETYMKTHRVA